jgi:hypothetical protein
VNGYAASPSYAAEGILLGGLTYDDAAKTITLNTSLTIPSGATLAVPPGYTLDLNGNSIQNNGQILNAGTINGTVSGNAAVTCDGDFFPVSGNAELFNGFYIAPGKTMTIASGQTVTVPVNFDATNDGTIVVEDGGTLDVAGNLTNRGLVLNYGGTVLGDTNSHPGFGTGGTLTLSGSTWTATGVVPLPDGFTIGSGQILAIPAGAAVAVSGSAVNDGTLVIDGTLLVYGTLTNNGSINNNTSGTLDNKGGIENLGTVMDNGTFVNEQGAVVNNRLTGVDEAGGMSFALLHVTVVGTLDNYGVINNWATILVEGDFINEVDGVVNNEEGAFFQVSQTGFFWNKGTMNNKGTLRNYGEEPRGIRNDGTINNDAPGVIDNNGYFYNRGKIEGDGEIDGSKAIIGGKEGIGEDDVNDGTSSDALDITKGFVTVSGVNESGDLVPLDAQATMVEQPDGTWVITAPEGADLHNLALSFTLPDGAAIDPPNGTLRDFSSGHVKYTVTADGQLRSYWVQVKLPSEAAVKVAGALIATNAEYWKFVQSDGGGGRVAFAIEAPLISGDVRPDHDSTLSVDLGAAYTSVQFNTTVNTTGTPVKWSTPVVKITGAAANLAALVNGLKISRVEWEAGGVGYYQDLPKAIAYADLNPDNPDGGLSAAAGGGDDSGCDVVAWPLFAILCAAGLAAARRKR